MGMLTLLNSILKLEGIVTDVAGYIWHETSVVLVQQYNCSTILESIALVRLVLVRLVMLG